MAYSVAYQHTDSNRNDDGSYVVHGTLETEQGLANHRQTLYYYMLLIPKNKTSASIKKHIATNTFY